LDFKSVVIVTTSLLFENERNKQTRSCRTGLILATLFCGIENHKRDIFQKTDATDVALKIELLSKIEVHILGDSSYGR